MSESSRATASFSGVGRWIAVASELPCMVIAFLFVGQFAGTAWFGPPGSVPGALVGALLGFIFGVYSVYITIQRFEEIERVTRSKTRQYMPPEEEIFEEYDWSSKTNE